MNEMSKQKSPPAATALSPVQAGLSTAGMYRLIEQARDACTVLDEQQAAMPKDAHLQSRINLGHQGFTGNIRSTSRKRHRS